MVENEPVRTEGVLTDVLINRSVNGLFLRARSAHPLCGQVVSRHVFENNYWRIRAHLRGILDDKRAGKAKQHLRADMVMKVLGIARQVRDVYPSGEEVARRAGGNERTWRRTVAKLRAMGLLTTYRLRRDNMGEKTLSVNLLDLTALWQWLLDELNAVREFRRRQLRPKTVTIEQVGGALWIKQHGIWECLSGPAEARGSHG